MLQLLLGSGIAHSAPARMAWSVGGTGLNFFLMWSFTSGFRSGRRVSPAEQREGL